MSGGQEEEQNQDVVLTRLTNNWAGVEPGKRKGLLPPIKHKLHTAVENFPVIPPISSVTETSDPVTTVGRSRVPDTEGSSRQQRNIRTRNSHLRKVYLVSLTQLLTVLLIVVVFTEVDTVREFNNRHPWFGVLLTGKSSRVINSQIFVSSFVSVLMLIFLCSWIMIVICFPSAKQQTFYNVSILLIFTICEGLLFGKFNLPESEMI